MTGIPNDTFVLRGADGEPQHYCVVEGKIHGPFVTAGAAAAGMAVEIRRAAKRRQRDAVKIVDAGLPPEVSLADMVPVGSA